MDKSEKLINIKYIRDFIFVYILIILVLSLSFYLIYRAESKNNFMKIANKENIAVRLQHSSVCNIFSNVVDDLNIISNQNEMKELLIKNNKANRNSLALEFYDFVFERKAYDQLRYIDNNGMEIVRVNFSNGKAKIVVESELQSKKNRYYFTDTIKLNLGEIFISPMDLNVEKGKVEMPLKPMIRFGIPVFDKHGNKKGIILVNYLGKKIIDNVRMLSQTTLGEVIIVNQDRYMLASPDPEEEWAFMFPEKKDKTFEMKFSRVWNKISDNYNGQILNEYGLFTYITAYPIDFSQSDTVCSENMNTAVSVKSTNGYFWKIISHIKPENFKSNNGSFLSYFIITLLYVLAIIPSFIIALLLGRKRMMHEELIHNANYDLLTGLPNRSLFYDRLSQVFAYSQRYENKFVVLFMDLDDFKMVNDTLGHEIGDTLLKQVAHRLTGVIRSSDTLARLGGDEFTAILQNIDNANDTEKAVKMIINEISKPFDVDGNKINIGISVGVSFFPADANNIETLVNKADNAMYVAKSNGKNSYSFA